MGKSDNKNWLHTHVELFYMRFLWEDYSKIVNLYIKCLYLPDKYSGARPTSHSAPAEADNKMKSLSNKRQGGGEREREERGERGGNWLWQPETLFYSSSRTGFLMWKQERFLPRVACLWIGINKSFEAWSLPTLRLRNQQIWSGSMQRFW